MKKKKIDTENSLIYKSMSMEDLAEIMPCLEREGYFSDTPDFSEYFYGQLTEVYASYHHEYAFYGEGVGFKTAFKYFIPKLSVVFEKKEKKKLRPFKDVEEFFEETGLELGKTIRYRKKDDTDRECVFLINGYINDGRILLGSVSYQLDYLVKYYEYYDIGTSKWKPFGVEE